MVSVDIVVCTFERAELLSRAIRSIFDVDGTDRANVRIVIVDNSDTGSARAIVDHITPRRNVSLIYLQAHPPNISIARNVGVAATTADVVAFLDDDQEVEQGWLLAVLDGLSRFPHDVFFGSISPRFEDADSINPAAKAMFTRSIEAEAGSEVMAFGQRRGPRFALATANSIFRRQRTLNELSPFDETFGHSGGEDFHLFCRLQQQGLRFAWLPDARARDFVPKHRCSYDYLARRHFSGGQTFAASVVKASPTPRKTAAWIFAKAIVQAAVLIVSAPVMLATQKRTSKDMAMRLASVRGKLFWRGLYPLYRREHVIRPASSSRLGSPPG